MLDTTACRYANWRRVSTDGAENGVGRFNEVSEQKYDTES
jgi:hypothetical protein